MPQNLAKVQFLGMVNNMDSAWIDNLVSVEMPIDNVIPTGLWWEGDGACWGAVCDEFADERGWRWQPRNIKAFAKERPRGAMRDFWLPLDLSNVSALTSPLP